MLTYDSRGDRALADDPAWERIKSKDGSGRPHPPPVLPVQNGTRRRTASPVDYLLPASIDWLMSLPREVRAVALASKYPRIVNLIVQHWNNYDACCACFADLLADRRGNRRGFPADVHSDIRMLQEHYLRSRLTVRGAVSIS